MATPTVYTPKRLFIPQQLGTATQRYYASPLSPGAGTQLKEIMLTNTTTSATTVTVYLVDSGNFPVTNNILINAVSVPIDGNPLVFEFDGLYMTAGDELHAKASVASRVNIHASGVELA